MVRGNGKEDPISLGTTVFAKARDIWREGALAAAEAFYKMTRRGRFAVKVNGSVAGESADQDYSSEGDYFRMIAIGRQFDRDDLIAGAAVNRLVGNVIQCGFNYDPKTGSREANLILKARFDSYAQNADEVELAGKYGLHELGRMLFRDMIVSGDIFVSKLKDGRQQVFEGHRCKTPNNLSTDVKNLCIHGVQLDEHRRNVAFYFTRDDIALSQSVQLKQVQRISAYDKNGFKNVIHVNHPKRTTQTRGVTKFAPIADAVPMHADIQFAKMVQQQQVSSWSVLRERPMGFELPDNTVEYADLLEDPCRPGQMRSVMQVSPGMMWTGFPGEKLLGFAPNVPNPTFFDHARQMQQLIGINLDIPLVMLLLDASETNFSGFRGALEQAKLSFVALQEWFAKIYYSEILLWQMRMWSDPAHPLADPAIVTLAQAGIDVFAHEWVLPAWPYIQPVDDANADAIKLRTGMTSLRRAHQARGQDFDTVAEEMVEDRKVLIIAAKQAAAEINAMFPADKEPAHWRDLCPLPTNEGESLALPSVEPERAQAAKPAPTDKPPGKKSNGN